MPEMRQVLHEILSAAVVLTPTGRAYQFADELAVGLLLGDIGLHESGAPGGTESELLVKVAAIGVDRRAVTIDVAAVVKAEAALRTFD
jgi:hypothetical protein